MKFLLYNKINIHFLKNIAMKKITFLFVFIVGSLTNSVNAQNGYNPLSMEKIHESDIMYKKTIVRRLRLDEKQNLPFFAVSAEITRIIMDAVKQEKLTPYISDSCITTMTKEEFILKIKDDRLGGGAADLTSDDTDDWGDVDQGPSTQTVSDEYLPKDIYILDLLEDLIFDKQRSLMYYDPLVITMTVPGENTLKGFDMPVASFKYKDLMEIFRQDERAVWHNAFNDSEQYNFADAFKLRLFGSYITKISNPKDEVLSDIYGGDLGGINAAKAESYKLFEYEHNLWEY